MRASEADVSIAVIKYLFNTPHHKETIRQIKKELPKYISLSNEDRQKSGTRRGEELWEQQVRNIVSHRDTPGNFIYEGRIAYSPRSLSLTASGKIFAQKL